MAALLSTGLETTPSSDLRGARSSPREVGIRLFAMGLAMSVLLVLAGWILLKTASGLQPSEAVPGARPDALSPSQDPAPVWQASSINAAGLPREWAWERPAVRFEHMYREPR